MEKLSTTGIADRLHIHQIHYDGASRAMLDPGFIPLDNSTDTRPDWYEFWVIRRYLLGHELKDDHWYGFLSPKFTGKTSLTSTQVFNFLSHIDSQGADVGLALCHFNEIALYWNCFEQGERIHPGLTEITEQWLRESGFHANIRQIVNHTNNFTYCNYVLAKKNYWIEWLKLADSLLAVSEGKSCALKDRINSQTNHAGKKKAIPMKVFMQERFPALLLTDPKLRFKIATTEHPGNHNLPPPSALAQHYTHAFMATLNRLKMWYDAKRDIEYSKEFFQLRKLFLQAAQTH